MDVEGSRTNSNLGSSVSDGSTKYAHSSPTQQTNRIQSYNDISSNSLGKMDATTSRPCAIIGPDRVLPSNSGDVYLKKSVEPWPCQENVYRHTTDYQSKMSEYQPNRNISPRQTFQENMQRIMVPPTYSSIKIPDESSSKNTKLNMPHEAKYCDVPYNNSVNNELKSVRNPDIPLSNMNPAFGRSVPPYGWPPGVNVRPLRPYGAPDFYQYSEYPSCAGPRPMAMVRQHQALNGESTQMYPDHLYQESNIRFKPYPLAKERHQQVRYDYLNNYPNTFHPPNPFPSHRYDLQKSIHGHPYPVYPQIPVKYLDRRIHEPITDSYQRSPNTPNFNMAYRNQPVAPPYGPLSGNCVQNKPYPPDCSSKSNNKVPFEPNSKVYVDLEAKHNKGYPITDNLYLNEMNHHQSLRGDILLPPHSTLGMHTVPQHAIYRKDSTYPKNFEYNIQYRTFDQPVNNSLPRFPLQYSPNTLAISPSDSNTSNDTAHTLGTPQEDCGYVSQSSTTSVRSLDSYNMQATNDTLRRHNYNTYGLYRNNGKEMIAKRKNSSSDKRNINVRQFLQMWNEGDDDVSESNKETVTPNNSTKNDEEQLYVLGLVNVPSNEIGKYEHIQKISKLPENIKGYNSLELLNQYEELLEPSHAEKYASKPLMMRQCHSSMRNIINKERIPVPRPVSPLDVEAKISQSVIHKEVGCNFEIKPCSPEMLNVEIATPVQNILGERTIEKVINPVIPHSPLLQSVDENNIQNTNAIKNSSCKMTNHPFIPESSNGNIKVNNYSSQDLETNAGMCLASLPQLDNDLELNFPEINQQFINANKRESNTHFSPKISILVDPDQTPNVLHEKSGPQQINLLSPHTASGTEKEVSKLSKYRKNKRVEPSIPSPNEFAKTIISSSPAQRIDSVIIKNPDNIKIQDLQSNTSYGLNTLLDDHNDNFNNNNLSLEKAIDFSLNKMDVDIHVEDNILNNMNCHENHAIEGHRNTITNCNNEIMNAELKKQEFTIKQGTDKDTEVKSDGTKTLENATESDEMVKDVFTTQRGEVEEAIKHVISSETKPDNGSQQNDCLIKVIQNIDVGNCSQPTATLDSVSETCKMKQDDFLLNLQQENVDEDVAENILSYRENDAKNVVTKQEKLPVVCQFSGLKDNSNFGDIVSDSITENPAAQHFNNITDIAHQNDTLKTESPVLSVIQSRTAFDEVSLFSDPPLSFIDENKSVINKKRVQITMTTPQKASEVTSTFSLPILEHIPENNAELFNTISKSERKTMETSPVAKADEVTMCDESICDETTDIAHSSSPKEDEKFSLRKNSCDTNLIEAATGFKEVLHNNALLHVDNNNIESNNIPISALITNSDKILKENCVSENQDFAKNLVKFDSESIYSDYTKNNIDLNGTYEPQDLSITQLENIDYEKALQTVQRDEVINENENVTEKYYEDLPSFSLDKVNTNTDSVIDEITTEAIKLVKCNNITNLCKENNRENVSENDLDTLKFSVSQNEHVLVNNDFNMELNFNELSNKNDDSILNEIKSIEDNTEMSTDEVICSILNEESSNVCPKNFKIHKSLFSPWIQKLIMHTEGIHVSHKLIKNENGFNKGLNETSKTMENQDETILKDFKKSFSENFVEDVDVSVNKNYTPENIINTSDTTLVLILSTDNTQADLRPVDEINNCGITTAQEVITQKTEECSERTAHSPAKDSNKSKFFGNKPQNILKRSLSESALDMKNNDDSNLLIPTKRKKENDNLQPNITAEDLCNIVQSNRRNSVSTFYNHDSVYILIDNNLIITEEREDSDKICFANTDECIPTEECEPVFEKIENTLNDLHRSESGESDDYRNEIQSNDEKSTVESWFEDVACIETVLSDDVAEDITIPETNSTKISTEEDFEDDDDSRVSEELSQSPHMNKVRNIHDDSLSNENVQLLKTLYRTPQMDVKKTLVDIESHNVEPLQDKTLETHVQDNEKHELKNVYLTQHHCLIDDKENLSNDSLLESTTLNPYGDIKENNGDVLFSNEKSLNECILHSCETSIENIMSNTQKDNSHNSYSSSPEVSSTTSEEKGILLKITNYNCSRSSQINEITDGINKLSYKLTETQEYRSYKSNFSSGRTLITKAAQKYIPPLKETIGDLKVKLPLPQHHLNKLKQLKKSKVEPKITENIIRYKNRNLKAEMPKKVKPKFEDVLKSIDEMQFKKKKDKSKRGKSEIPKVVIKKGEDGAHYTSSNPSNNNEVYNPDLTGRKWQPWVFLEKDNFIDRMAIKKKHKAVYCHRKNTYVLAEKFRKYKSVYNAKFVITQPKTGNTAHGNLKYTIKLQHK